MLFSLLLLQDLTQTPTYDLNWIIQKFNEGGLFMWPILVCLIIGLSVAIAKLWTLNRASINTRKFLVEVKQALDEGGIKAAEEKCANTRGPIAAVFQAGLLRAEEGIDAAEKAIVAYGQIEMSFLERGLIVISTMISLAPMLGFTGTVQGMVDAFDAIKAAKDISPDVVAGGIAVALLTTLFGLVVAMILQVFYNYFVSKIDRIVIDMEESSIELIDSLVMIQRGKKVSGK
ncbi:MAG: MotA/TolQ/ExbB proton channel family protein [Bacteroidetes bacterium]|nr:MotA/TolQ/ExbB proton channel family protein [Bacteroidota bacterium]